MPSAPVFLPLEKELLACCCRHTSTRGWAKGGGESWLPKISGLNKIIWLMGTWGCLEPELVDLFCILWPQPLGMPGGGGAQPPFDLPLCPGILTQHLSFFHCTLASLPVVPMLAQPGLLMFT